MEARTHSEALTNQINELVIYKEFTFDGNKIINPITSTEIELADNVMWLDDLFILFEVKERNLEESTVSLERWFNNKVLRKAKSQISTSLAFLEENPHLELTNTRGQKLSFDYTAIKERFSVILYDPKQATPESIRFKKFYESKKVGLIHLFHLEDYLEVCKCLQTPHEVKEYLDFREKMFLEHRSVIETLPEQYMLGHFLVTDYELAIQPTYIHKINEFKDDRDFDLSGIIRLLGNTETYTLQPQHELDYHAILKFFGKLSREYLIEVKARIKQVIARSKEPEEDCLPRRFCIDRPKYGFVTVVIPENYEKNKYDFVNAHVQQYAYKRKTSLCLGVGVTNIGKEYNFVWVVYSETWRYDQLKEQNLLNEKELYGNGQTIEIPRYNYNE